MSLNFLYTAVPAVLGYLNQRKDVSDRNRERLKQHARNEAKYRNDFNRDVLLWRNESQDREIAVDNKWQDVLSKIASDDLKLWSGISKAGVSTQQAYATMMSVGASEQTGARSQTTSNRRKAVLEYAGRMAEVANRLSLSSDNAALNRSTWGNEFTRFAQESQVKTISGRPMPGTPPASIPLENKPDLLSGLILPLVGGYINFRHTQSQAGALGAPFSDDEMRPTPPTPDDPLPPGIPEEIPEGSFIPNWETGGLGKEQIGDFFTKRERNRASSRLGSSFLTTAT